MIVYCKHKVYRLLLFPPVTGQCSYEKGKEDKEEKEDFDDYDISPPKKLTSGIRDFLETALSKCIPKHKRECLANE